MHSDYPDHVLRSSGDSLDPEHHQPADYDPNAILTEAPRDRFKLGYYSVMALLINRMIGMDDTLGERILLTPHKAQVSLPTPEKYLGRPIAQGLP
jgi:hypothetical protein